MCSLTFETPFRAGGLRPGQPSGRSSSEVRQRGQAVVEDNFLQASEARSFGHAPTTWTAGRKTRNAGPSGLERKGQFPGHPRRTRAFGPRRRRGWTPRRFGGGAQRPRGSLGNSARTSAGSSEPAERTSPRRWSVRSHHTSVLAGAPLRHRRFGGGVGSVAASTAGLRVSRKALRPRSRVRANPVEQLRQHHGRREDSSAPGWSQGSRQPTATSR